MIYSPLHIYLQPVNDFGGEQGDPENTHNDALVHAQVGESLTDPVVVDDTEDGRKTLEGTWKIQDREWDEHADRASAYVQRQLTLFIRKI